MEEIRRSAEMWIYRGVGREVTFSSLTRPHLLEWLEPEALPEATLVDQALSECNRLQLVRTSTGDLWPVVEPTLINTPKLQQVLGDVDASELFEICLGRLSANDWAARSLLARGVWKLLAPRPVGELLGWPSNLESYDRPWSEIFK